MVWSQWVPGGLEAQLQPIVLVEFSQVGYLARVQGRRRREKGVKVMERRDGVGTTTLGHVLRYIHRQYKGLQIVCTRSQSNPTHPRAFTFIIVLEHHREHVPSGSPQELPIRFPEDGAWLSRGRGCLHILGVHWSTRVPSIAKHCRECPGNAGHHVPDLE